MSRINRSTYWLGIVLIIAVVLLVSSISGGGLSITVGGLLALILLGPPRLHDFGLSGWSLLAPVAAFLAVKLFAESVVIVPLGFFLLSDIVLLAGLAVIGAIPGRTAINRFGPKQRPLSRR